MNRSILTVVGVVIVATTGVVHGLMTASVATAAGARREEAAGASGERSR